MIPLRRHLIVAGLGAILILSASAAAALPQSSAPIGFGPSQGELLEPRWLAWLGCWELTADTVDYREVADTGKRVVCVAPRPDGLGINLTTYLDEVVMAENSVVADGRESELQQPGCNGLQSTSWSADGRRLYTKLTADCRNGMSRSMAGLSLIAEGDRWLELQSMSVPDSPYRDLIVRQYQRLDAITTTQLGYAPLQAGLAVGAAQARAAAAGPLDLDDVIEATERVPVEVVEAAVIESNSVFALDGEALIRLADAGLEDRLIDVMVAVSFPDQFLVDSGPQSSGGGGGGYGGYGGAYVSARYGYYSCLGPYYGSLYSPYGYGCDPWYSPWGYGSYRPPYYSGGGGGGGNIPIRVPPSGSLYGGKMIKGRGYAEANDGGGTPEIQPTGAAASSYTVRRAVSRRSSVKTGSGKRSGSSKVGAYKGAVSRGGFSKGGSRSRSSAGSSGGSSSGTRRTATRKAKPKGGG